MKIVGGMAYRGDKTDPLENTIQSRRWMFRWVLISLVMMLAWHVIPILGRVDLSRLASPRPGPSESIEAPSPKMSARALSPKMSAQALEKLLRNAPVSGEAARNVRCLPGTNGWDYVCLYQTDAPYPLSRLKIGVRVSPDRILQASSPHTLQKQLPHAGVRSTS